jgi:hypothetical protein
MTNLYNTFPSSSSISFFLKYTHVLQLASGRLSAQAVSSEQPALLRPDFLSQVRLLTGVPAATASSACGRALCALKPLQFWPLRLHCAPPGVDRGMKTPVQWCTCCRTAADVAATFCQGRQPGSRWWGVPGGVVEHPVGRWRQRWP